jgi:rfaE bifunctional protein kinase chain/domain
MNESRAQEIVGAFAGKRILVVGDVMLDEYIWGQVNRVSPEAPVIVVDAERQSQVPGGAANVVNNLCALGATGMIVGIIGSDTAGASLAGALQTEGADITGLVTASERPTTRKTRIIAHSQQVVRVDHERRAAVSEAMVSRLLEQIETLAPTADAILLSDYQKGVLTPDVISACLVAGQRKSIPVTGNLKPAALTQKTALTAITLNLSEASIATGGRVLSDDRSLEEAGRQLLAQTGSKNVLITRGSQGLTLFSADAPSQYVPARPVEVYDVAGAGDTVVSTMTLALAAGATMLEAVTIANHAAAEAVKKLGVSTVTPREVLDSFTA